ncbi:MAG: b-brl protein [Ignavibacteria bacterium]|nr:b-brl protein [Ignavibacteria bacterium]
MKKFSIFIIVLMFSSYVFAQNTPISKGKFLLNGSFAIETAWGDAYEIKNYDDWLYPTKVISTENSIALNTIAKINYFLFDGLGIGTSVVFSGAQGGRIQGFFGLGLQAAYFFDISTKVKVNTLIYPYIGLSYMKSLGSTGSPKYDYNNGYSFGPCLMIMLTNSVALNIELLFQRDLYDFEHYDSSSSRKIISSITGSKIATIVGISASL